MKDGEKVRDANLFILGVQKSGTTSLAAHINSHPEIFVPSVKETYYFCLDENFQRGTSWYEQEFFAPSSAASARYRADATPLNLASETALERIADYCGPEARFIVILRDPISRAISAYRHQVRLGNEEMSLEAALDAEQERVDKMREAKGRWWRHAYVTVGKYGEQLERAFDLLGRERFLILPQQALQDVAALNRQLEMFLDVASPFEATKIPRENSASMPRSALVRNLVSRQNPIKSLAQSIVPREMRSWIGLTIDSWNARPAEVLEVSEDTRERLAKAFEADQELLARLDLGAEESGFSFRGTLLDVRK